MVRKKIEMKKCFMFATIFCTILFFSSCDTTGSDKIMGKWISKSVHQGVQRVINLDLISDKGNDGLTYSFAWKTFDGGVENNDLSFEGEFTFDDEVDLNGDEKNDKVIHIGDASAIYFLENNGYNLKLIVFSVDENENEIITNYYFEKLGE